MCTLMIEDSHDDNDDDDNGDDDDCNNNCDLDSRYDETTLDVLMTTTTRLRYMANVNPEG